MFVESLQPGFEIENTGFETRARHSGILWQLSNNCFHELIKTKLNCKKSDSVRSGGHLKTKKKPGMKKQVYNNLKTFDKTKKIIYKDSNHNYQVNYCKLTLCGDIEVNPGPTFNNPIRIIHAPYSRRAC